MDTLAILYNRKFEKFSERSFSTSLTSHSRGEVASAKKEMDLLLPFIDENTMQLLPLARQQIERVREAYANNKASLQDLLRARDQLLITGIAPAVTGLE